MLPVAPAHSVEGCQSLRGRMFLANGNPSVRIWVTGTKRILGVSQNIEGSQPLPAEIQRLWDSAGKDPWTHNLVGDFRVCALTKQRPGAMQFVRVEGGQHVRVVAAR